MNFEYFSAPLNMPKINNPLAFNTQRTKQKLNNNDSRYNTHFIKPINNLYHNILTEESNNSDSRRNTHFIKPINNLNYNIFTEESNANNNNNNNDANNQLINYYNLVQVQDEENIYNMDEEYNYIIYDENN